MKVVGFTGARTSPSACGTISPRLRIRLARLSSQTETGCVNISGGFSGRGRPRSKKPDQWTGTSKGTAWKPLYLTGEVSVGGKPIEKGRILFYSNDGQIVGCIIRDGKYKIEKPNTGALTATVDGPNVPNKYSDPETSGLRCEVKADVKNLMIFDLQPR